MAPSSLLKHIWRHKSMGHIRIPSVHEPNPAPKQTAVGSRPRTAQSELAAPPPGSPLPLGTIAEKDVDCDMSTGESMDERTPVGEALTVDASHSNGIDQWKHCDRLIREVGAMTASHLDTIETTLVLLQALENLSPHVEPLRREIQAKKEYCEKVLGRFDDFQKREMEDGLEIAEEKGT